MTSIGEIYFYTLRIAVLSTVVAALIGIPASFFTARRNFFGRKFLLSLSAIPLCVPSLIVALGYVNFWGINGYINKIFGTDFSFLYTSTGIIIAQGFYNFPFVMGIVNDAWEALPREQANAARLLGASEKRVFFTVTLKQLSGTIAAALIPVFLFCFFSFMIVMLFSPVGASTLEVEIYHSLRNTLDIKSGAKLAILETVTALAIVVIYSIIVRRSQITCSDINYVENERKSEKKDNIFLIPLMILVFLFFIGPFLAVFISGFTELFKIVQRANFWKAIGNSIWIGCCTGLLCTIFGFIYSVSVKINKKQGSVILQTIPILPMAISSVVISWVAGLIFHRGNPFRLICLQTLLYWPIAYRQIQSGINRITTETDKAASLMSRGPIDSIFRVYIPSCAPVLLSSFAYCFAISLGDATMPLMLSIPEFNTLALYTYRLAGSYRFSQACACGGIVALLSMIIYRSGKK